MANYNEVSWTAGTIIFGGSTVFNVLSGSTGTMNSPNVRYIVYWDKEQSNIYQTIIESSYDPSPNKVVVMELTTGVNGEDVQIVTRDIASGSSDRLNSDSFNKIVGGTFATGPLTGVGTPPASGVLFNNTGFYMYDGSSASEAVHLKTDGLRFYNGSGNVTARYDGSAVTYYNATASTVDASDVMAVLNASSLTFYNNSGEGASNKTVSLIGNNSTASNNGLYVYGISASSFGVNDQSLVTFESVGGVQYGHMGMYTESSVNYLTLSGKTDTGIYLHSNGNPGGAGGNIVLAPNVSGGIQQVGTTNAGTAVGQTFQMPHYTHTTPSVDPINQIWIWPSAAPSNGQYLEADTVVGGLTTALKWSTPTFTAHNLHSTALASGSVPVPEYGTFRYTSAATGGDVLAFASAQTNATPAAATERSSFWTMFSEGDSSSNRLVIEPSVTWSSASGYDNYSYIGWHNYVYSISGYYHNAGDGSASFPSFAFYGDGNTGFYRIASGHTGYSDDGTLKVNFGGHTFATIYNNSGTPTASTVTPEFSVAGSGAFSSYLYVGELRPVTDNVSDIGTASRRFDNIYATNSTISTSDVRAKENIYPSTLGLDFINDLNPVSYQWKAKQDKKLNQTHYGIIAQEVIETLKKYGIDSLDDFGGIHGDEETYYGARYSEFVPILMKAVQELSVEIKELKEKN